MQYPTNSEHKYVHRIMGHLIRCDIVKVARSCRSCKTQTASPSASAYEKLDRNSSARFSSKQYFLS